MTLRVVGIAIAVAVLSCPAVAHGGTYTVSGCRSSWTPVIRNTSGDSSAVAASDVCAAATDPMLEAGFAEP